MVGSIDYSNLVLAWSPRFPYAIRAHETDSRRPHTSAHEPNYDPDGHHPIAPGLSPGHPLWVRAVHHISVSLTLSVTASRSDRLGSKTSDHPASKTPPHLKKDFPSHVASLSIPSMPRLNISPLTAPSLTPSEHNLDSPRHIASSHPSATDINVEAVAAGLSESLFTYGLRDWEHVTETTSYATQFAYTSNLAALSLSPLLSVITLPITNDLTPPEFASLLPKAV